MEMSIPLQTPVTQSPFLVIAFATGVLMFFSPCSVGLLPAYLTYFLAEGRKDNEESGPFSPFRTLGLIVFLLGGIPLFYGAVAGINIRLPAYSFVVSMGRMGTGSYIPPVFFVVLGILLWISTVRSKGFLRGLHVGGSATLGIVAVYLAIGFPIVVLGDWLRDYLISLQLLAGPIIVLLGITYYLEVDIFDVATVQLPVLDEASTSKFLVFGVLYGVGSLACNIPLFFIIVTDTFASEGLVQGMIAFLALALGMGTLMIGVTVIMATTEITLSLGSYAKKVRVIGSIGLVIIGMYFTWYTLRSFGYV